MNKEKNIKNIVEELKVLKAQLSEDYLFNVAMHAQEVIQHEPIIGKIRETAIEGLKKYADHPTSSLYEFFKKVFLESDKVLTDTGNKK